MNMRGVPEADREALRAAKRAAVEANRLLDQERQRTNLLRVREEIRSLQIAASGIGDQTTELRQANNERQERLDRGAPGF